MKKPEPMPFWEWIDKYYPVFDAERGYDPISGMSRSELKREYNEIRKRELRLYENWMKGKGGQGC